MPSTVDRVNSPMTMETEGTMVKTAELRATALSFSLEIPSSRHRLQDLRRKTADSPTIYRTPAVTRT